MGQKGARIDWDFLLLVLSACMNSKFNYGVFIFCVGLGFLLNEPNSSPLQPWQF